MLSYSLFCQPWSLWTRQFGTSEDERSEDIVADSSGNGVYVVGITYGTFPGPTNKGDADAFLVKFATEDDDKINNHDDGDNKKNKKKPNHGVG